MMNSKQIFKRYTPVMTISLQNVKQNTECIKPKFRFHILMTITNKHMVLGM
jgi:hypothetical protein